MKKDVMYVVCGTEGCTCPARPGYEDFDEETLEDALEKIRQRRNRFFLLPDLRLAEDAHQIDTDEGSLIKALETVIDLARQYPDSFSSEILSTVEAILL